jgi:hypothetical protein
VTKQHVEGYIEVVAEAMCHLAKYDQGRDVMIQPAFLSNLLGSIALKYIQKLDQEEL